MWLRVNPRSPIPMYQQIVNAVKEAVAKGLLKPGERLPTVRELASEYAINHNTVAKAYQELEREHVIQTLRSKGTFVGDLDTVPNVKEKMHEFQDLIKTVIVEAHHLRITPSELKRIFVAEVDEWTEAREVRERNERD
jgi:GntR family transcriptional regulator